MQSQPFFVIGNGPSLKGFDFKRLSAFKTLGMNAAYRHWDRIDWYPTHYCCLDNELIVTHHNEIRRLVLDGKVRSAFVAGNFFEFHPDLAKDARFLSFDQVSPHWHRARGAALGLPFVDHPAFRTSDSSKVTTGAFSARYAAYLGHRFIAMMGVDLKYVEVLKEAEHGEGISLIMKETPKSNPNYFFDDYQQAGDRYNIPNPTQHNGELHPISFRVLRDDFQNLGLPTRIVNCNPTSVLQQLGLLPYEDIDALIGESALGSIAVPCNKAELDQILANVRLWAQAGFAPYLGEIPARRPKLVFVFNNSDDEKEMVEAIAEVVEATNLARFFDEILYRFLDLRGEHDAYIRRYDKPVGKSGYKAGPNNQFFATMDAVKEFGRYAFLMETDCVPVRPDWLRRLERTVAAAERFWIMGSAYRGVDQIAQKFGRHINGNAIYAAGDPEFQAFCQEYWRAGLSEMVDKADRTLAYDCALEVMLGQGRSDVEGDEIWRLWQSRAHLFRYTNLIQNISAKKDLAAAHGDMVREILKDSPETLIVHSQPVAVAARELLASPAEAEPAALRPRPKGAGATAGVASLAFVSAHATGEVSTAENSYQLAAGPNENYIALRFSGVIRSGDKLRSVLRVTVDEDNELQIALSRDGGSKWESTRKVEKLVKGDNTITLEHRFRFPHKGARIQIGAVDRQALVEIVESSIQLTA